VTAPLIPGKILVVDDCREDVNHIIERFREDGYGVIFRDKPSDDISRMSSIRLVILDQNLSGEDLGADPEIPALVLKKLAEGGSSFYLIAVWSKYVKDEDDPDNQHLLDNLKDAYEKQTGNSLPDLFLKPFGKTRIEQKELVERISGWIEETPSAGLVFEWERLLNKARDCATSRILDLEGGSLVSLVKTLHDEVGDGTDRGLVRLFNKVLLRCMTSADRAPILELLEQLRDGGEIDPEWYAGFHQFQAYCFPGQAELIWTGDIIRTGETDHRKAYAIVITPQCDFAQNKAEQIKMAYAMRVGYKPEDQEPAFAAIYPDKKFLEDENYSGTAKNFLNAVAGIKNARIGERFYILRSVQIGGGNFHLIVDLHNIRSFPRQEAEKDWSQKRICRLDSPYIEDLFQCYTALSGRVGIPAIPEEMCKAEAKRLEGK
jgi:hypothetical protein